MRPSAVSDMDFLLLRAAFPFVHAAGSGLRHNTGRKNMADSPKAPVGGCIFADDPISFNESRPSVSIKVRNTGDRPIQVGSHYHFFEVNKSLSFDRKEAFGFRLDIPSGTSVRFEPGEEKTVNLTELGGKQEVFGLNDLTRGRDREAAEKEAAEKGFFGEGYDER